MHKKYYKKTSLKNMNKSGKSAYFRHIFANNIFFLNGFEISMKFCVFWYLFDFFGEKVFKVILVLFSNFEAKRPKNGKKTENLFYKHVLEFDYAIINELVHPSC